MTHTKPNVQWLVADTFQGEVVLSRGVLSSGTLSRGCYAVGGVLSTIGNDIITTPIVNRMTYRQV